MVKKAADQTGANYSAGAMIAWDAEVYDTDSIHDNATNNTRLTVPSGVTRVILSANCRMANVATGTIITFLLFKNGSALFDGEVGTNIALGTTIPIVSFCSGPISVAAGDYFEVQLTTNGDSSIDITATRSNFAMQIVG
jgi:hypothetical protein